MRTSVVNAAGNYPDLLSGILSVQVRNEDKITEQDRLYCQNQQDLLYKSLDQIDRWYSIFKEEAEQYKEKRKFFYADNGKASVDDIDLRDYDSDGYSHNEFKPFGALNDLVKKNYNANCNFANRIIDYFNKTYNVSVIVPYIDEKTLPMGFRPIFETYVDAVIEHLGGKSFRDTAEEELIYRFLKVVQPSRWSKIKPELKKDKISFPEIIRFDDFYIQYSNRCKVAYNYTHELETLCAGIAYGADDILNGNSEIIIRFDDNDVSTYDWYNLTTTNAEQIKFFKNGRIDVKFKDSAAAESCFKRLRLNEITLRED